MDWNGRLAAAETAARDTLERALAALAGTSEAVDTGHSPVDTLASALETHRDALAALERVAQEWSAAGRPPRRAAGSRGADAIRREPKAGARVC